MLQVVLLVVSYDHGLGVIPCVCMCTLHVCPSNRQVLFLSSHKGGQTPSTLRHGINKTFLKKGNKMSLSKVKQKKKKLEG